MLKFPSMKYLLAGTILFVYIPFSEASPPRLSYGEACSKLQRCNPRAFLNCANGHFCDCIKPSTMIFHETLNKCVILVREKCPVTTGTGNRGLLEAPCVPNAGCKDNVCQCLPGHYPHSNGSCQGNQDNRGNCQDEGCDSGGGGGGTTLSSNAVSTAELPVQSELNSSTTTGKCVDSNGTSGHDLVSNSCHVLPGHPCLSDSNGSISTRRCATGLLCRNFTCECPYKDHQEYHSIKGHCFSLIDGPCNSTENCLRDAECLAIDDRHDGIKLCRCMKGFNPVDRKCELAFGEKCVQGQGDDIRKCDRLGPLECNSGKCACSDFQVYNEESLKCNGLVGAKCDPKDSMFCVQGAECYVFRGFVGQNGMCSCQSVFRLQADRTCSKY